MRFYRLASSLLVASGIAFALAGVASCVGDDPTSPPSGDGSTGGQDGSTPTGDSATSDGGSVTDAGGGGDADAAVNPAWTFALTGRTSLGSVVIEPSTGDVYAAGWSHGAVPELGIIGGDDNDALVVKLDAATGAVKWAKTWGGTGDDQITGLVIAGGALFAVGSTTSPQIVYAGANPGASITFPSTTVVPATLATESFVMRIDPSSGGAAWAFSPDATETAGTAHRSACASITFGATTGAIFVGCSYGGPKFGGPTSYAPALVATLGQSAIFKINTVGGYFGITKTFAASSGIALVSDIVASGGYIYAAASVSDSLIDKFPDGGSVNIANGNGNGNGVILRFPEAGGGDDVVLWKADGTTGTFIVPSRMAVTGTSLYVTGQYMGSPDFGGIDAGAPPTNANAFLAELPLGLGSTTLLTGFGGTNEDDGYGVVVDGTSTPSAWVSGRYLSTDFSFAGTALTAAPVGSYQAFVAKLTTTGTPSAVTGLLAPNGNAEVNALASDNPNAYLISVGDYNGLITFDDKKTATSTSDSAGFVTRRKL